MERRRGANNDLGPMSFEPNQLYTLLASIDAGARRLVVRGIRRMTNEVLCYRGSARVKPQPAGCHRIACCIDQPSAVALARHADGHHPT
jgi:hypothetical protein